jgi:4'-phosphopantetheinyl transferase
MIHSLMQTVADLPALPHALWLSPPERERLATFHIPKRREEWLLGRWTAKMLVRQYLAEQEAHAPELYELSVEAGPSGAPEVRIERPALRVELEGVRLSISHSAGVAFCALDDEGQCVGADVERIEPRHPAFAGDYFTPAELHLIAGAPEGRRDLLITAIWSAKEAALKALCLGLTVDTRLVECLPGPSSDGWAPVDITLAAAVPNRRPLAGWWRKQGGYVLTLGTSA